MPIKRWNDAQKLILLRTAIAYSPNFTFNATQAAQVAQHWPAENDEDKPSAGSVQKNFSNIMKHARDLETLRQLREEGSGKKEEVFDVKDHPTTSVELEPTARPAPTSATRTPGIKYKGSNASAGSKRKRGGRFNSSEIDTKSDSETSSGSETEIVSPTPARRRTLPLRKGRRVAPMLSEHIDNEKDAGKNYDSHSSDGEYDFLEERRKKAVIKAKEAKKAAKRARK